MTADATPWRALAACLGLCLAVLAVLHPTLAAGFIYDDWTFLAIARHLPDPLAYFLDDHSPAYYYRPNGMLSWWLLVRAFGLDAPAHYLVQMLVQVGCGLALFLLLGRLGHSRRAAWAGALLFVVHPATVSTASWLSDRFDLMATLGVLLATGLAAAARPARPAMLVALALATLLAVGSKETGVLAGPLVFLLMLTRTELALRDRFFVLAAAGIPILLWAGLRIALLGSDLGRPPGSSLFADATQGMGNWLGWLPSAMALDLGTIGAFVAASMVVLALVTGVAQWRGAVGRRLALGLALLLLPALVQWPTTVHALSADDALLHTMNLRFFHLSTAGLVLLVVQFVESGSRYFGPDRNVAAALLVALAAAVFPSAHHRSAGLAAITADATPLAIEAALQQSFRSLAKGPGCRLSFQMPATANLPGFADHVAKAGLPRGHVALDSLVLSNPMPWHAVVGAAGATPEALFPLRSRRFDDGREIGVRAIGPLSTVYLEDPRPDDPPNPLCEPLFLRWDGAGFVPSA